MDKTYIVTIDYKKFVFTDRNEALDFADTAFASAEKRDTTVCINLVEEVKGDE